MPSYRFFHDNDGNHDDVDANLNRIHFPMDDEIVFIKAVWNFSEPNIFEHLIPKAVCYKNVEETMKNVFSDFLSKYSNDTEVDFKSNEKFLENKRETGILYFYCLH